MKILIIKLGAIGDVIRTTAVLPGLKSKYKNCRIDWVTKKDSADVLKNNSLIDKIFLIGNALKSLKGKKYELVICLDDEHAACELASSIKSKKITGAYLNNNKRAYTEDSALWFGMGLISRLGKKKADKLKSRNKKTYQEIIYKILDLKYGRQEPMLALNGNELGFGKKFAEKNKIKKSGLVVGINTGAGGRWEDKKLSEESTAKLIDKLNDELKSRNARVILFGGPEEAERNGKIKSLARSEIIDAGCNNSLMEFASLVNLCSILVTSDSLALHIGTALKKKIVVFFGPTSSAEIELYFRGIKIIPKKGCLCCYRQKCNVPPEYNVDDMANAVKKLSSIK
ncbi:glycosyltransferase family 9 protein [Candidatus Woesearchaeota archaeon]|nr:glycosyltransferase family 9 protein [Candidatus Woesearchaeota archaeon]